MVFLSSYSAVSKLSYLIGDSVLLAMAAWKVRAPPALLAGLAECVHFGEHAASTCARRIGVAQTVLYRLGAS